MDALAFQKSIVDGFLVPRALSGETIPSRILKVLFCYLYASCAPFASTFCPLEVSGEFPLFLGTPHCLANSLGVTMCPANRWKNIATKIQYTPRHHRPVPLGTIGPYPKAPQARTPRIYIEFQTALDIFSMKLGGTVLKISLYTQLFA